MDEMNMNFGNENVGFDNGYMPMPEPKSGVSNGLKAAGLVGGGLAAGVICTGALCGLVLGVRHLVEDGIKVGTKIYKVIKEAKTTGEKKDDLPNAEEIN